jgi:hypothetical protein
MNSNVLEKFWHFTIPKPNPIFKGNLNYKSFNIIILFIIDINLPDFLNQDIDCPICYKIIDVKYHPNCCSHFFCRYCIYNWSKNKKTCPICRKSFTKII